MIQLIGSNLNQFGNNGQFETDPSTWGFDLPGYFTLSRSALPYTGLYAMRAHVVANPEPEQYISGVQVSQAVFPSEEGKKYIITCYVRSFGALSPGLGPLKFKIHDGDTEIISDEFIYTSDNPGAYIPLVVKFTATTSGLCFIYLVVQGDDITNPTDDVWVDKFEIFEYIDIVVDCTIAIDNAATVITDETTLGGNDGSITIAVTGGIAPFEYSKDNGLTWQSSNVFTGLAPGVYVCKVQEANRITCVASQSFAINASSQPASLTFTEVVTNESILGASDGAIIITPLHGTAPYLFSKDGGATFQSSNNFSNLVPGVYTVIVKDALGSQSAHNVVVNPGTSVFENVYFSKNPIVKTVPAKSGWQNLTNYRLYDDVRVEEVTGSSVFNSKLRVDLKPAVNGQVQFQVREAFRKTLKAIAPDFNTNTIVQLTDRIKFFKHYTGELQDLAVVPTSLTPSSVQLVMFGGIDKFNYPTLSYFTSYLPANKKFMTWAPTIKRIGRTQEDYLNFWIYSPSIHTIKLTIKAYFDDGTNQTSIVLTKAGVRYGELYQIPAGVINTGVTLLDVTKNVTRYDLWLVNETDTIISEVRSYIIDIIKLPNLRFFMFLNSLGAYEVLSFYGQAETDAQFDRSTITKYLPIGYKPTDGELETNKITVTNKYNYSSGYMKGSLAKEWLAYMRDFMLSERIYDITDGKRRPVSITDGNIPDADQNNSYFFRFNVQDSYTNQSYTPKL